MSSKSTNYLHGFLHLLKAAFISLLKAGFPSKNHFICRWKVSGHNPMSPKGFERE